MNSIFLQVMLRLQDHRLEHGHRIKGRATTFRAVAIPQPLDQPPPEIVKRGLENLQRITVLADLIKML